jgi:transcriptional regulator with XRE-family HTH domain
MTDKKKQPGKTANTTSSGAEAVTPPELNRSVQRNEQDNEPWKKWKVKPDLVPMPEAPSESGIGKRIAYCRGQLNTLSVEALARYTKNFDADGISRMSMIRYESGENTPGAREIRVLCDALWVTPNWLLLGTIDSNSLNTDAVKFVDATKLFVLGFLSEHHFATAAFDPMSAKQRAEKEIALRPQKEIEEIEKRQKWMDEARKPSPR